MISFLLLNCDRVHTETGAVVQNHRNRILTRRWSGKSTTIDAIALLPREGCTRTSRRRLDWILRPLPLSVDPAVVLAHREALANARHVLVIWLIQGGEAFPGSRCGRSRRHRNAPVFSRRLQLDRLLDSRSAAVRWLPNAVGSAGPVFQGAAHFDLELVEKPDARPSHPRAHLPDATLH